jgi:hypothetical protein
MPLTRRGGGGQHLCPSRSLNDKSCVLLLSYSFASLAHPAPTPSPLQPHCNVILSALHSVIQLYSIDSDVNLCLIHCFTASLNGMGCINLVPISCLANRQLGYQAPPLNCNSHSVILALVQCVCGGYNEFYCKGRMVCNSDNFLYG